MRRQYCVSLKSDNQKPSAKYNFAVYDCLKLIQYTISLMIFVVESPSIYIKTAFCHTLFGESNKFDDELAIIKLHF